MIQIFIALEELVNLREQTAAQLVVARESSVALQRVSEDVTELARRYAPAAARVA